MVGTGVGRAIGGAAIAVAAIAWLPAPALHAETLESALILAYRNNPQLNAQRASLRATDEGVPQALSGYRVRVTASGDMGAQQFISESTNSFSIFNSSQFLNPGLASGATPFGGPTTHTSAGIRPRGGNVGFVQPVFSGFRPGNQTRQAEGAVLAARETLRNVEQTVLLDGATSYMNVLRDSAILDLQRRNVQVLQEQLRQTRDRFNVGEVTRTDVAQSESRLAAAQSSALGAESNLKTSQAAYRRVIGAEPANLRPGMPVDRLSPRALDASVAQSLSEHPQVLAAQYTTDAAQFAVKVAEGALYPTVTFEGSMQRRFDLAPGSLEQTTATVLGRVNVPLYQGGAEYSVIRQAKETLGQRRIELDFARDQVRAAVVQSWGQLEATKAQIVAAQSQVTAAEVALNGVREEARVGQRTTLDVLNAQQELVNARVALVTAQRDRVVASFTLLASVGRLSPQALALAVDHYDPRTHYHQVRDTWFGVRTPDGR